MGVENGQPNSIWNDDLPWGDGMVHDPLEDLWRPLQAKEEPIGLPPEPADRQVSPEEDWS